MSDVKFIRVRGRVIPVKGKGSAPKGVSKRYGAKREKPKAKSLGIAEGAKLGASLGFLVTGTKDLMTMAYKGNQQLKAAKAGLSTVGGVRVPSFKKSVKGTIIGAIAGAAIGSLKFSRKGKGESNAQASKRIAGNKK